MAKRWGILFVALCLSVVTSKAGTPEYFKADSVSVSRGALMAFGGEIEKKLARGLHISAEGEVRLKEMNNFKPNVNHLKLIEVGGKLSYKTSLEVWCLSSFWFSNSAINSNNKRLPTNKSV